MQHQKGKIRSPTGQCCLPESAIILHVGREYGRVSGGASGADLHDCCRIVLHVTAPTRNCELIAIFGCSSGGLQIMGKLCNENRLHRFG